LTQRQRIDERNEALQAEILRMGTLAVEMIRLAVDSVISGDLTLAQRVIAMDDEVDLIEKQTIHETIVSMGMHAPVARDLVILTSTLNIIGEVEKVADEAVKLARRATKLVGRFPAEMKLALQQMGDASSRLVGEALRLYSDYDPNLAHQIIHSDKEIDAQFREARDKFFELIRRSPEDTEHLVRAIEVFHALEHVADRSVEIASRLRMQMETGAES
jgi:phosphate transport system protein